MGRIRVFLLLLIAIIGLLAVQPSPSFAVQSGMASVVMTNTTTVPAHDLHVQAYYWKEVSWGWEATPVDSLSVSVSGLPAGWGETTSPDGGPASFTSDGTTVTPHAGSPVNPGQSVTIYVLSIPPPTQIRCYWTWESGVPIGGSEESFIVTPYNIQELGVVSTPATSGWSLALGAIGGLLLVGWSLSLGKPKPLRA